MTYTLNFKVETANMDYSIYIYITFDSPQIILIKGYQGFYLR